MCTLYSEQTEQQSHHICMLQPLLSGNYIRVCVRLVLLDGLVLIKLEPIEEPPSPFFVYNLHPCHAIGITPLGKIVDTQANNLT